MDARQFELAAVCFREAVTLAADNEPAWFNLGIATKHLGLWEECFQACDAASKLVPFEKGAPVWWNLGIAATALGDWQNARRAWTNYGIRLPDGEGPIDMNAGPTPIRINPNEHPEVVWTHRIDPARALILSIPTPDSKRRYRDLVLHDGEPVGVREFRGRSVSVFNELAVIEHSLYQTWEAQIETASRDAVAELESLIRSEGGECEDWTQNLRHLCRACSEGNPSEHHHHDQDDAWTAERRIGIAFQGTDPTPIITEWETRESGRKIIDVRCMLG